MPRLIQIKASVLELRNQPALAGEALPEDVLEKIPACQWAVKACSRQLEDLEKAKRAEFPCRFDHEKASRICRFIEMLPHIRGEWAKSGSRIELQPLQVFVFCNPETGTRWSDARKPWDAARKAAGYPWLPVRDLRPAFATEAADRGAPMHFIQSALGHGSVAVTEKYYAKYAPEAAARQLLRVIEGGRNRMSGGTRTGTTGD